MPTEMKRFYLLVIALILHSFAYAGMEEERGVREQSLAPYQENAHERNPISFPFDATLAIPHQHPAVAGGQNPDRNFKSVSSTYSGVDFWIYWFPIHKGNWERKLNASVYRFILFLNLRL